MTKQQFAETNIDYEKLYQIALNKRTTDKSIFEYIGKLDKKHKDNEYYISMIDGIICDIGADRKSIILLNYAYSRLGEKIGKEPDNSTYVFNRANCILSLAEIDCPWPYSIEKLIDTKRFNEARMQFLSVKQEKEKHYERSLTNSANILEKYGRNYEAIYCYDQVLTENPGFGMALGNKGLAIDYYIRLSPQKSFRLMRKEVEILEKAVSSSGTVEIGGRKAKESFEKRLNEIREYLIANNQLTENSPIKERRLTEYEKFVLKNNIYLNFDFGYYYDVHSIQDELFPAFIETVHTEKYEKNGLMSESIYFAFQTFNQIIESYISSRYLFFSILNRKYQSLDKRTNFIYTYDYTIHGIKYGLLKSIFCNLYNCLDKVAYLVTLYYVTDQATLPKDVYFQWLQSKEFADIVIRENDYQLLALRNLSLDFEQGYQYYYLRTRRNRITHSFMNINDGIAYSMDYIHFEITEEMLIDDVASMFRIVKAAMLYFTIAVKNKKIDGTMFPLEATLEKDIYK